MNELKIFEVRDRGTFSPVVAIGIMVLGQDIPDYLLERSGYGKHTSYVLLTRLDDNKTNYEWQNWHDRTFTVAHEHIIDNWSLLKTGDVIDVEFILGETTVKKTSEFYGEVHIK